MSIAEQPAWPTVDPDLRETMTVTVRDRSAEAPWGSGPTNAVIRAITISAYCRTCGGRRGEPRGLNQCDDGAYYWTQVWDNPCGHRDQYADLVTEAATLNATSEVVDLGGDLDQIHTEAGEVIALLLSGADPEAAASRQETLLATVVRAVAEQHPQAVEMACVAVTVMDTPGARWSG